MRALRTEFRQFSCRPPQVHQILLREIQDFLLKTDSPRCKRRRCGQHVPGYTRMYTALRRTMSRFRDVSWARRSAAASASSSESSLLSLPSSCGTRHGIRKDTSWDARRCLNLFECQLANTKLAMQTTTKGIDIFPNTTDLQERIWKQTCLFQS